MPVKIRWHTEKRGRYMADIGFVGSPWDEEKVLIDMAMTLHRMESRIVAVLTRLSKQSKGAEQAVTRDKVAITPLADISGRVEGQRLVSAPDKCEKSDLQKLVEDALKLAESTTFVKIPESHPFGYRLVTYSRYVQVMETAKRIKANWEQAKKEDGE